MKKEAKFWFYGAVAIVSLALLCCILLFSGGSQARLWPLHSSPVASAAPVGNGATVTSPGRPADATQATGPSLTKTAAALSMSGTSRMAQPVSLIAGHPVEYPGQFAVASVRVDGKNYQLTPNQSGNFPKVFIQPKGLVHVEVAYPQGQAGDAVVLESEDGGGLDGKKTATVTALNNQQSVKFDFQATEQPGIYRVALRNGPDVKVLSFWAGPLPTMRP